MLKAYHEKPKPELVILNKRLGLESPMHSKDCVGQVAEKEEDTESEVRLENDIIEESQSNWSSPCILVPKHDGGFRF